jgi:hypothetical protein
MALRGTLGKRKIAHLYIQCVMGSQNGGTGSYWSIYLRLQTTETPLLLASSGGEGRVNYYTVYG